MSKYLFLFLFIFVFLNTSAQRAIGSWQDYLSYSEATKVAVASDKIYCATEGGLFFYDLEDNSVNKLSNIFKLSDSGIQTIAVDEQNDVLIIAYKNSNIDLVYKTGIMNLSDIKRKQITGDKTVNNITFIGNEAFLSCGFGIVVLNLDKKEVKDTYFIGEGGTTLGVNDVEQHAGFLFAATNAGVYSADINSNLSDFNNWVREENIPGASGKFHQVETHSGEIIAASTNGEWGGDKMFMRSNGSWSAYNSGVNNIREIRSNNNMLTIASWAEVFFIDQNHSIAGMINAYQISGNEIKPIKPKSSAISENGSIWIADENLALIKYGGESFESIVPNGPSDNSVFSLHHSGTDLWITPGGTRGYEIPRFQSFKNGDWKLYSKLSNPELDKDIFTNIVAIAVNPFDENHFYAASWNGGLLEFKNDELINRFTNKNSPLETALPSQPDAPFVRVGGLDFDTEGNLWLTNSESSKNLHKLSQQGDWTSIALPEVALSRAIGSVVVTQNNDKWVVVPRGYDAYVVKGSGEIKKRLLVTSYFNNGENEIFNRMSDIYSIAEDLNGAIWLGTSKGVAVYNNPSRIWDSDSFFATQPSLDLNDGLYHPLLETETVTAIAVDGANRKWFGTQNSGVYLISETGEQEMLHFTKENSPLFSNTITAISINQKNGEVFIGTDDGLISYMGEAIGGKESYSDVYVYPNPVRETYDGPITVTGLIENSDVKITDISGNLVFKTTSLGGQAVWDGTNLNGNRVKTGVYLVFCNDEQGEETHIAKLLFIN